VSRNLTVFFVFCTWRARWTICRRGCIIAFVQSGGPYTNWKLTEIVLWNLIIGKAHKFTLLEFLIFLYDWALISLIMIIRWL